jgi:hypothetical protein
MEATLASLVLHLAELQETLGACVLTASEDRPDGRLTRIIQELEEQLEDALGGVVQTAAHATALRAMSAEDPAPYGRMRRELRSCHGRHLEVDRLLRDDLGDPVRQLELARYVQRRGAAWPGWLKIVRDGVDVARSRANSVDDDLLACWVELTDRIGQINVSVQAVGQQFATEGALPELAPSERTMR